MARKTDPYNSNPRAVAGNAMEAMSCDDIPVEAVPVLIVALADFKPTIGAV